MIPVKLSTLITIYLFIVLGVIFTAWLWSDWQRRRRERLALRYRLRCGICAFEFEDRSDEVLPRCPRCGSLNERFRFSTL